MTGMMYSGADQKARGELQAYALDLEHGADRNDFELTVPASVKLDVGGLIWLPGTCVGGMVRNADVRREKGTTYRVYRGPTWTGLLEEKVLKPPSGQSHLVLSGDLNDVLANLITRLSLGDVLQAAPACGVSVTNYQFARYVDGWTAVRALLTSKGMRLNVAREGQGKTIIGAVPSRLWEDRGTWGFSVEREKPVNHLVCLGAGELTERVVVDLYANAAGAVSQTQTLFGVNEIAQTYDSNGMEREELIESGTEKLRDLQTPDSVSISLPDGGEWELGDRVRVLDAATGITASATIERAVINAGAYWPAPTAIYECGDAIIEEG